MQQNIPSLTIEEIYTRYHGTILAYFLSRKWSREDAEDLTQDTFLKAWKAIDTAPRAYLLPWLYCIARHLAIDTRRKHLLTRPIEGKQDETPYPDAHSQEDAILTRLSLVEVFRRIPPRHQQAILLSAYGYSLAEVAALTHYSSKSIHCILHRGRKTLKRHLQGVS